MGINEVQDKIIEEFEIFDDWMDRYALLIEEGNNLKPLDPIFKTQENLIVGCQSRVWLHAEFDNGKIKFSAESDAIIIKGIIALLLRVLSNRTPDEIIDAQLYFIDKIGLKEHLSPTRSNGLLAMIKQIKFYAMALKVKYQ